MTYVLEKSFAKYDEFQIKLLSLQPSWIDGL